MTAMPGGGRFLMEAAEPASVFTPERFTADDRLMAKTMEEFLRREVLPLNERIEAQESGFMRALLQQASALGLTASGLPALYGGLELPVSMRALLAERSAAQLSFAVSLSVHAGVAVLPLLALGTPEQKQRYLPKLASGEWIGAFALTEANAGSDALSAQTKAVLSPDGTHYLLSGEKLWITNGGFADLFTVFARLEGAGFTAFLVEREAPGVVVGREERKMGLHGSSTCRLLLQEARISAENLLGAPGQGHRAALNALNLGRLNIAAIALGACKVTLQLAAQYARQRTQFGQPIAHFGLIQQKLGEMAAQTFALESLLYRTCGYLDAAFAELDYAAPDAGERFQKAAAEYAIECAIAKFLGTETLSYVVDEALQIHGGYGFSEEFPIAQFYRDARVFRIFEGTNEINRLTVVDQLLRRVQRRKLAFAPDTSLARPSHPVPAEESAETSSDTLRALFKPLFLAARERFGDSLAEAQETAATLADLAGALYALESVWLRSRQLTSASDAANPISSGGLARAAAQVYGSDLNARLESWVGWALVGADETARRPIERLLPARGVTLPAEAVALRRALAAAVLEREAYPWD